MAPVKVDVPPLLAVLSMMNVVLKPLEVIAPLPLMPSAD